MSAPSIQSHATYASWVGGTTYTFTTQDISGAQELVLGIGVQLGAGQTVAISGITGGSLNWKRRGSQINALGGVPYTFEEWYADVSGYGGGGGIPASYISAYSLVLAIPAGWVLVPDIPALHSLADPFPAWVPAADAAAIASGTVAVTITFSQAPDSALVSSVAIDGSGASGDRAWDPNGVLPAVGFDISVSPALHYSTTYPNDLLLSFIYLNSPSAADAPVGWTVLDSFHTNHVNYAHMGVAYKQVSATQNNVGLTWGFNYAPMQVFVDALTDTVPAPAVQLQSQTISAP